MPQGTDGSQNCSLIIMICMLMKDSTQIVCTAADMVADLHAPSVIPAKLDFI